MSSTKSKRNNIKKLKEDIENDILGTKSKSKEDKKVSKESKKESKEDVTKDKKESKEDVTKDKKESKEDFTDDKKESKEDFTDDKKESKEDSTDDKKESKEDDPLKHIILMSESTTSISKNNVLIKKLMKEAIPKMYLMHQYIVYRWFIENPFERGLLLYWSLGSGKTIGSLLCASTFSNKVIVIAPKKIKSSFEEQSKILKLKMMFIPLKSNKIETRIENEVFKEIINEDLDFDISTLTGNVFDNTAIIIDECHLFSNSVVNGAKMAIKLYEKLISAVNVRIILSSGTIMVNDAFELVVLFNILHGRAVFPEIRSQFMLGYGTEKIHKQIKDMNGQEKTVVRYKIKNKIDFETKIFGKVSYYNSNNKVIHTSKSNNIDEELDDENILNSIMTLENPLRNNSHFPTVTRKVIRIPMTNKQYSDYLIKYEKEFQEMKDNINFNHEIDGEKFAKEKSKSSYMIGTRLVSDYCDMDNFPKCVFMFKEIKKRKNQVCVIYSNFIEIMINKISEYFEAHGNWKNFYDKTDDDDPKTEYYCKIIGGVNEKEVAELIDIATSKDNAYGDIIRLFLISPAANSGINIFSGRLIFISEPFFNRMTTEQAANRIIRYDGHAFLPEKEQTAEVIELIATYPVHTTYKPSRETNEEKIYNMGMIKEIKNSAYLRPIKEASIDCRINYGKDCLSCKPTGQKLFSDELLNFSCPTCISEDINDINIKAKSIQFDGKKYMYNIEHGIDDMGITINIYQYDVNTEFYHQLKRSDSRFDDIIKLILKQDPQKLNKIHKKLKVKQDPQKVKQVKQDQQKVKQVKS